MPVPPGTPPLSGTLLGFDFGEKRLGVAVGETATRLAHPVGAIAAGSAIASAATTATTCRPRRGSRVESAQTIAPETSASRGRR